MEKNKYIKFGKRTVTTVITVIVANLCEIEGL
jgi:hypothetical protein